MQVIASVILPLPEGRITKRACEYIVLLHVEGTSLREPSPVFRYSVLQLGQHARRLTMVGVIQDIPIRKHVEHVCRVQVPGG